VSDANPQSAAASVIVILGSPADMSWSDRITAALDRYGVPSEVVIASAHKTPQYLLERLSEWERCNSPLVYITVAGRSNALSGFVDAQVSRPVIACPPATDSFGGMDILSSLRMPRGVAPLVVLEPENAALAALKILGLAMSPLRDRVNESQAEERKRVVGGAG
jgi:5-(carboxyamino)imidazole ribonucleotide mutase